MAHNNGSIDNPFKAVSDGPAILNQMIAEDMGKSPLAGLAEPILCNSAQGAELVPSIAACKLSIFILIFI